MSSITKSSSGGGGMSGGGGALDIGSMFSDLGSQIHADILEGMDAFYGQAMDKKLFKIQDKLANNTVSNSIMERLLMQQQALKNARELDWERRFSMALGRRK